MDISKDGTTKVTLQDLEGLVEKQSADMTHLHQQCHSLTQQLEENSARHKQEMAELQSNLEYLTTKLEATSTERQWQPDATSQPAQDPYQYPTDNTLYQPTDTNSYQQENQQAPEYAADKPKSPSPKGRREKPLLSRSSSRGETADRPSSREEKKKNQLKRRESRLQMQGSSEFSRPTSYQAEEQYRPQSSEEQIFQPEIGSYQQSNQEGADYDRSYQPPAYIPEETTYQSDLNQYEYQDPVYQSGGDQDPYNYPETQQRDEQRYENQEPYMQEVIDTRNRTPSRESLRNSHESDTYQSQPRNRTPSRDSYEETNPQSHAVNDALRPRIPSSSDSIGPNSQPYNSEPRAYSPSQQSFNPPQSQQDYSGYNQPDQGRKQSNESFGGTAAERPKVQGPTVRRDSAMKPQQTKPQQRNTPTKLQS